MKVLFIVNQLFFFRHIEPVVSALISDGDQVGMWFGDREKENISDRAVQEFLSLHRVDYFHGISLRNDRWKVVLKVIRDLQGCRIYLKPGYTAPKSRIRFLEKLSPFARSVVGSRLGKWILSKEISYYFLSFMERLIPANKAISRELGRKTPDIVVIVTNLIWNAPEFEYLKASISLGIPTVAMIASWDNLNTKGTLNLIPDAIILWNQALAEDAMILHHFPREKIVSTGAQTFDYLFDFKPTESIAEFCMRTGIDPARKFVLYLGSSASIAEDETRFVRELVSSLNKNLNVQVLIRPHPINHKIWASFDEAGAIVWPRNGDLPDTIGAKEDFCKALYFSQAVIGINTSAMLEAAVLDRPCITIMLDDYKASQDESGHFRHLLNGGFLEIAEDFDQASEILKRILNGEDRLKKNRKRFVSEFIRPRGINRPVGPLIAELIEQLDPKKGILAHA